jgi:hypothetical protein
MQTVPKRTKSRIDVSPSTDNISPNNSQRIPAIVAAWIAKELPD